MAAVSGRAFLVYMFTICRYICILYIGIYAYIGVCVEPGEVDARPSARILVVFIIFEPRAE